MSLKARTAAALGWYPVAPNVVAYCRYVSVKHGQCFRPAQWFRHVNFPISTTYRCDTHVIPKAKDR